MKIYTKVEYVWNGEEYVVDNAESIEYEGPVALCGGGGGGPTSSTVTQTNIPEYAQPYVESMLGAGMNQMFNTQTDATGDINITGFRPFVPYSNNAQDYFAGFSPLQTQVQYNAANLQTPGQFDPATQLAQGAGVGGYSTAQQAGRSGADYTAQATNPNAMQPWMSPYMQNVVDLQKTEARRQSDISGTQRGAAAAKAGAYGGGRQAIENAEANRALQGQLDAIQAQGQQTAYDKAVQNQQFAAGLNLQGIQGAQAGYGLAGQAAGTLGALGTQQLGAQKDILGLQNTIGGQQQQARQDLINQNISTYQQKQQNPMQSLNFLSGLLRGMPMSQANTQQYQAAPSAANQVASLGLGAAGISSLLGKKKGGVIRNPKGDGLDKLGLYNAMKGAR